MIDSDILIKLGLTLSVYIQVYTHKISRDEIYVHNRFTSKRLEHHHMVKLV